MITKEGVRFADFMSFPFSQVAMMEAMTSGQNLPSAGRQPLDLDLFHATSVPPFLEKSEEMLSVHQWFVAQVSNHQLSEKAVFGLQNPPPDSDRVQEFRNAGVRFMAIAYKGVNKYGGGFASPDVRLSPLGKKLLDQMAESGIVLDLSHAGHQTARDALAYIRFRGLRLRAVATHSGCFSVYRHPRNLPDDILREIVSSDGNREKGIIGLPTLTWLLHRSDDSVQAFRAHLAHLINLVGVDNICVGSDASYVPLDPLVEKENFNRMKAFLDQEDVFRLRFPEEPSSLHSPRRLHILHGLIHIWHTADVAKKVIGENLIRFVERLPL